MWSILRVVPVAIFALIGCFSYQPARATTFVAFDNTTQLSTTVPGDGTHTVLLSQPLTSSSGQILESIASVEVTNPTNDHPAHIWAELIISDQSNGTSGTVLDEANEKLDVRPGNHHCPRLKGGMKTLTGSEQYLNLVVWTDSGTGYDLDVEAGKLRLEGMVITPSSGATFTEYDSGAGGELLTTLPGDSQFHTVYSVNAGTLAVNDVLIVFADGQVSAQAGLSGIQRLTARLIRVDSTTGASFPLDQSNQFKIVSEDPTGNPVKVAVHQVNGATSENAVELELLSTTGLDVTSMGGRLEVLKIHPAS